MSEPLDSDTHIYPPHCPAAERGHRGVNVAIYVKNTLGRRLEVFEPFNPPLVRMYVCGPTVYDSTHIGHARSFVAFDAIKRYLRLRGYDVYHVQNITDIDDKILDRARREGRDWREIAETYTSEYLDVLNGLNVRVDFHPRVTHHIKEIIEFIQILVDKGFAYVAPSGSVYFDVDRYPFYGELSGRLSRDLWRQEEDVASEKRNPYDFALWKAAKPGEPWWESPWGRGRPGWHIECSVMSSRFLGGRLDIHGGGSDLIFPHHENEKAQSEAALGVRPWVKYWLHAGYLTVAGEKMSKSLGNIVPVKEAAGKWGYKTLRLWLLTAHYRSQLNYSEESLETARRLYERLSRTAQALRRHLESLGPAHAVSDAELGVIRSINDDIVGFHKEMSSDFNTAGALRHILNTVSTINEHVLSSNNSAVALAAYKALSEYNAVLGILDEDLEAARWEEAVPLDALVDLIVEVRSELRKLRMYELSDAIREKLLKLGIQVVDYKDRSEWFLRRAS
jgi:cysteinyl-tRNA synthetase